MASPFTSHFTDTVPIPGDEGQSVVIRKLAPRKLEIAQKKSQRQALEDIKALGGMAAYRELWGQQTEDTKKQADAPDPMIEHIYAALNSGDRAIIRTA